MKKYFKLLTGKRVHIVDEDCFTSPGATWAKCTLGGWGTCLQFIDNPSEEQICKTCLKIERGEK